MSKHRTFCNIKKIKKIENFKDVNSINNVRNTNNINDRTLTILIILRSRRTVGRLRGRAYLFDRLTDDRCFDTLPSVYSRAHPATHITVNAA